jgi:hypothetical protein
MPKPRVVCGRATAGFLLCLALPACGESKLSPDTEPGHDSAGRRVASPRRVGAHSAVGAAGADGANPGGDSQPGGTTFWQDAKPIFDAKCGRCHAEGGIGPFELHTYASAYEHRTHILAAVVSRHMPPWLADPSCDDYSNDPQLSDAQIETIRAWVQGGALEGDPASPGAKIDPGGVLALSRVDATVAMKAPYLQSIEPDEVRCFVLDWPETTARYVTGFRANPGNAKTVHHVIAYMASPAQQQVVEALDADAPGDGYPCYGSTGFQGRWVGVWEPNGMGLDLPEGLGVRVEVGSKLVVQMHYNADNLSMGSDQSSFDFKLDDAVEREANFAFFTNPAWLQGDMPIPADEALVTHRWEADLDWLTGGRAIDVYGIGTHQHQLGLSSHVSLQTAQGGSDCWLHIPDWHWHWQNSHEFSKPKRVSPGDFLQLECQWDNSAAHQRVVDGVQLTPKDVTWGESAGDEMCVAAFLWAFAEE